MSKQPNYLQFAEPLRNPLWLARAFRAAQLLSATEAISTESLLALLCAEFSCGEPRALNVVAALEHFKLARSVVGGWLAVDAVLAKAG